MFIYLFDGSMNQMNNETSKPETTKKNGGDDDSHVLRSHYVKGGVFLASVTGISVLFGFGMTLAMAKKRDPHSFLKGLDATSLPESGASLALRALGRGTLYSVSAFGVFCFVTWKLLGVHNLQELREKLQSAMPAIRRSKGEGRSDFGSIRELFEYLATERTAKDGVDDGTEVTNTKDVSNS